VESSNDPWTLAHEIAHAMRFKEKNPITNSGTHNFPWSRALAEERRSAGAELGASGGLLGLFGHPGAGAITSGIGAGISLSSSIPNTIEEIAAWQRARKILKTFGDELPEKSRAVKVAPYSYLLANLSGLTSGGVSMLLAMQAAKDSETA
jgi:hypothetical protein